MDINEKVLLLQLILEDIRGDWSENVLDRAEDALNLAEELDMPVFVENIGEFIDEVHEGDIDGRFFRDRYEFGGYMGLEEVHNLEHTIVDKSDEFKSNINTLNNPDCRFNDWDKYEM